MGDAIMKRGATDAYYFEFAYVSPPQHRISPFRNNFCVCELIWKHFDMINSGSGPESVEMVCGGQCEAVEAVLDDVR